MASLGIRNFWTKSRGWSSISLLPITILGYPSWTSSRGHPSRVGTRWARQRSLRWQHAEASLGHSSFWGRFSVLKDVSFLGWKTKHHHDPYCTHSILKPFFNPSTFQCWSQPFPQHTFSEVPRFECPSPYMDMTLNPWMWPFVPNVYIFRGTTTQSSAGSCWSISPLPIWCAQKKAYPVGHYPVMVILMLYHHVPFLQSIQDQWNP